MRFVISKVEIVSKKISNVCWLFWLLSRARWHISQVSISSPASGRIQLFWKLVSTHESHIKWWRSNYTCMSPFKSIRCQTKVVGYNSWSTPSSTDHFYLSGLLLKNTLTTIWWWSNFFVTILRMGFHHSLHKHGQQIHKQWFGIHLTSIGWFNVRSRRCSTRRTDVFVWCLSILWYGCERCF